MVNRLTVTLEQPEYSALLRMAVAELRSPPDQLRHILRTELERCGMWSPADASDYARINQKNAKAGVEVRRDD